MRKEFLPLSEEQGSLLSYALSTEVLTKALRKGRAPSIPQWT